MPPPRASSAAQEAEGRDAVAAADQQRLAVARRREREGRPSGPRHWATPPIGSEHEGLEPWPIALTNSVKVSRSGLASRIENGRRSGGSAETPALIITNWPGRASRAVSGVPEREQEVGTPEPLAADQGRGPVGGHPTDPSSGARRAAPLDRRRRFGYASLVPGRTLVSAALVASIGAACALDARPLPEPLAEAAPRKPSRSWCACCCPGRRSERCCSRCSRPPGVPCAGGARSAP